MSQFLQDDNNEDDDDNDDTKGITKDRVFYENSRAKKYLSISASDLVISQIPSNVISVCTNKHSVQP